MAVDEAKIRERAEQLWRQSGGPAGRDEEFWERAKRELEVEERNDQQRQPGSGLPPR